MPDSNLRADDLRGCRAFDPVTNHEANAKEIYSCAGSNKVFVVASIFNHYRYKDSAYRRCKAEGLSNVASSDDGVALYNL